MKRDMENRLKELSFQLRAPLGNILGYSNTLLKKDRPKEETEFLQAIHDSGKLILAILEEKLGKDFVSIDTYDTTGVKPLNRLHFREVQQLRILVVEDDILNIKLLEHLSKEYGLKADFAQHGKAAIEKLGTSSYDLVLMDIEMPEMNGYETTIYVRETLKSKIPVIALTAHSSPAEKEKALSVGMNGYLTKPVDLVRLLEIIYHTMSVKSGEKTLKNSPLTDFSYLNDTFMGKREPIKEMLDYTLQQVPEYLAELNATVTKADEPAIAKLAHKIKSAVSIMGVKQLGPILSELESIDKKPQSTDDIQRLTNDINTICLQALEEVKNERKKYS